MWLTLLARIGYVAKGLVYVLVGVRALRAVLEPVPPGGSQAAVERWGESLGVPFLVLLGLGLLCFALWRGVQVVFDPDDRGTSFKGLADRAGCALSGFFYGKLGKGALELALERPDADDPREQEQLAAFLFTQPLGQAVVAVAGMGLIGVGVFQLVKAYRGKFAVHLNYSGAALGVARFGLVARAVVFSLAGGYLMRASFTLNPRQVASLSEILAVLRQDGGPVVLAAMACGLIAYGLTMGLQARHYRLGHPAA